MQGAVRREYQYRLLPTNFVVRGGEVCYIDFECNPYMEEWNFENWGIKYWSMTPELKAYKIP